MRIFASIRSLPLVVVMLAISSAAFAQIGISVRIGPPALPVYEQPLCPGEGYLWTPGYWAYDYDVSDYYWVPGTWILAPEPGFLWTPGYWGWGGEGFFFHTGYWGPRIGFYGGINYGFGYFGNGYEGGRWDNGRFFYNRSVTNVNVTNIHNVYNTTVVNNTTINRVSYNGGNGGIEARPSPQQEAAARERHLAPVAAQTEHIQAARSNQQLRASVNQGRPPVAATERPGSFNGRGVVAAKEAGAPYRPAENRTAGNRAPENRPAETRANENRGGNQPKFVPPASSSNNNPGRAAMHAHDLQPPERPAAPNTGNAKSDRKYQQQQDKLYNRQNQEREKLQQQQDRDHQRMAQQKANDARSQQVEQRHQQQTQQLQQRHESQQQHLQQRQQPAQNQQHKNNR